MQASVTRGSTSAPLFTSWCQWSNAFFELSLITEGAAEKLSQFIMLLKSIKNKKNVLMNKNVFFEHCRRVKTVNNLSPFPVSAGMVLDN
jgi:hypothetical protein